MVEKKILDRVFLALSREPNVPKVLCVHTYCTKRKQLFYRLFYVRLACFAFLFLRNFIFSFISNILILSKKVKHKIDNLLIFHSILSDFIVARYHLQKKCDDNDDDVDNNDGIRLTFKTWWTKRLKPFIS